MMASAKPRYPTDQDSGNRGQVRSRFFQEPEQDEIKKALRLVIKC